MWILIAISGAAFFALILLLISVLLIQGFVTLRMTLILATAIIWVAASIAAISFTEDGWEVEGTTGEWIVAASINPTWAMMMYFFPRWKKTDDDTIDLNDRERLEKL